MPDRLPSRRTNGPGALVLTALGGACVVGTFLPWLRNGRRTRSSYELFEIVERLGFAPGGAVGVLLRMWPVVPLLVTSGVVLTWWHRPLAGLVVATASAAYVGGVSLALVVGAHDRPVDLGIGPVWCSATSAAFLVAAVVLHQVRRVRHEPPRDPPVPSPHAHPR